MSQHLLDLCSATPTISTTAVPARTSRLNTRLSTYKPDQSTGYRVIAPDPTQRAKQAKANRFLIGCSHSMQQHLRKADCSSSLVLTSLSSQLGRHHWQTALLVTKCSGAILLHHHSHHRPRHQTMHQFPKAAILNTPSR